MPHGIRYLAFDTEWPFEIPILFADYSYVLAEAAQVSGENTITVRQAQDLNWKWGVTDLHLYALGVMPTSTDGFEMS